MKYHYIIRIAAGIILIMATVFIHNAIAIYQFSQQNQTRVTDCAIVGGAGVSANPLLTTRNFLLQRIPAFTLYACTK
ncbi:YdcF-like/sfiX involved in mureinsynthesis [Salmonella enterica]|uniref:YdcF-like/sfiX involved in mureinsynthesis n=1 Tax=Salmonella enterica TaxID=28901 RepID=A0A379QPC6_SALER|nr:YdcF-like/sfiX involved in mureinsynthesis [Salmonella enterica]